MCGVRFSIYRGWICLSERIFIDVSAVSRAVRFPTSSAFNVQNAKRLLPNLRQIIRHILKLYEYHLKKFHHYLEAKIKLDVTSTEIRWKPDVQFPVDDITELSVKQLATESNPSTAFNDDQDRFFG